MKTLKELQKEKKTIIKKQTIAVKKQKLIEAIDVAKAKGVPISDVTKIIGFKMGTDNIGRVARSKNYDKIIQVLKERPALIKQLKKYRDDIPQRVEKIETKKLIRKSKKIEKITGVTVGGRNTSKYGVANPEVLKMTKDEYVNLGVQKNALSPDRETNIRTLKNRLKKMYDEARKIAKESSVSNINKESENYASSFLDTYFKNIDGYDKLRIIKTYLNMLPVQKRYDMLAVLESNKFKQVYDSDPENSGYESSLSVGERSDLRADQLIKILSNETGKVVDKFEGHEITFKGKTQISEHFKFENMID